MGSPPVDKNEMPSLSTANSTPLRSHVRSTVHSSALALIRTNRQVSVASGSPPAGLGSVRLARVTDDSVLVSVHPSTHLGTSAPPPSLGAPAGSTRDEPPFFAPPPTCSGRFDVMFPAPKKLNMSRNAEPSSRTLTPTLTSAEEMEAERAAAGRGLGEKGAEAEQRTPPATVHSRSCSSNMAVSPSAASSTPRCRAARCGAWPMARSLLHARRGRRGRIDRSEAAAACALRRAIRFAHTHVK
jgi:hypothetical protein